MHYVKVLLVEGRPTLGRPQGSHPLILTTLAHTKTRICHCPLCGLCMGGGRVVRSGDPGGRPRVGLWPLNVMSMRATIKAYHPSTQALAPTEPSIGTKVYVYSVPIIHPLVPCQPNLFIPNVYSLSSTTSLTVQRKP